MPYPVRSGQFTGAGGQPYGTDKEAYLSNFNNFQGQYTDTDGRVYRTERELQAARWDRGEIDRSKL